MDEGEDLLSALVREILEETGISIEDGSLVAVASNLSNSVLLFDFLCRAVSGEPTPSSESPEVRRASREEALTLVTRPAMRRRLQKLFAFDGTPTYCAYEFSGGDPLTLAVRVERPI